MKDEFNFKFDPAKNLTLAKTRGISFDEIITWIEEGRVIDVISHPNFQKYPNQSIFMVVYNAYVYAVPCVQNGKDIFLKTIYPSRKLTNKYLRR